MYFMIVMGHIPSASPIISVFTSTVAATKSYHLCPFPITEFGVGQNTTLVNVVSHLNDDMSQHLRRPKLDDEDADCHFGLYPTILGKSFHVQFNLPA